MREESGIDARLSDLPRGPGALASMGDRFQPDLVRGSGSYAVRIECPAGPYGLRPSLTLGYSTGSGNGVFGQGWRLNTPYLSRRSDRGVPSYDDERDTFTLSDAELLVPVGGGRFRPRTETRFWEITRQPEGWRVRTGDGRTLLFGRTDATRESHAGAIFAWYLDQEVDAGGNTISYRYRRDGERLFLDQVSYSIFSIAVGYEDRPDVLRNGRAGFLRTTRLRARSIEVACTRADPSMLRSYQLGYRQAENGASLLARIDLTASVDGVTASGPPLVFDYTSFSTDAASLTELRALVPPPSLDAPGVQLVDLTDDGLPDVVQSDGPRMLFWRNEGDGQLAGPIATAELPSPINLARQNVAFADLDADGRVEVFAADQPLQVAFSANGRGGFDPQPTIFRDQPTLRLASPDTRLLDVDGDGVVDLIASGRENLLLFRHETGVGWQPPEAIRRIADLDVFPDLAFTQRGVRLADMTGDGLHDFVLAESGHVVYWPYLGNGHWGQQVEMARSPVFPPGFRDDKLHLVDIDGDGCADVVLVEADRITIWINRAGVEFAPPRELPIAPRSSQARLQIADLLGDGRPGLVWSDTAAVEDGTGYRFVRFGDGTKPYLLSSVDNGLGGRFEVEYGTSTEMRAVDAAEGRPWTGPLPFVVNVVSAIRERDTVTNRQVTTRIRYHDAVYDGHERELRGFSAVTVDTEGDASIPAARQETTFFQGDPDADDLFDRARQRALAGTMLATRTLEATDSGYVLRQQSTHEWQARLEADGGTAGTQVFFPFAARIETREESRGTDPSRIERVFLEDFDAHGNTRRRRRESHAEGEPPERWIRSEERYTYTTNEPNWLVKLPVRLELRDGAGVLQAARINYYDGSALIGLPEGEVTAGMLTRARELRLLLSRLPTDYVGGRDLAAWGLELDGTGDARGYYATANAIRRDARGNVIEQRDGAGARLVFEYDGDGVFPIRSTDAVGRTTQFTFSPRSGEPSLIEFPDGKIVRQEFDPLGRLSANFESVRGGSEDLVKCWIVDVASRPYSVTAIAPARAGRRPEEFRGVDLTTVEGIAVARLYYDGSGRELLEIVTGPDGANGPRFVARRRYQFNGRGLVSGEFSPHFVPDLSFRAATGSPDVRYGYDVHGNVLRQHGPAPARFRVERDAFTIVHFDGDAAGDFDAPAPAGAASRVERFDARAQLVAVEEAPGDPDQAVTGYDVGGDGRVAAIRDDAGEEVVRYARAGAPAPIRIVHRDLGARTYYHDAAGRLRERVEPDGGRLLYGYDPAGRLTRIDSAAPGGGTTTVRRLVYDRDPTQPSDGRFLDGRIAFTAEGEVELHYSYDRSGRLVKEERTVGGVTLAAQRSYDLQGRLESITYPDGFRLRYTLDRSGAATAIDGVLSAVDYAANGNLLGYRLANGVTVEMPRDAASLRLQATRARRDSTLLRELTYGYDTVGNIVRVRDAAGAGLETTVFGYDRLHRLTSFATHAGEESGPTIRSGTYGYDPAGNLQQYDDTTPLAMAYSDATHPGRLTSVAGAAGTRALSYDGRARVRAFGDLSSIGYDAMDRTTTIETSSGARVTLAHDPLSRRVMKTTVANGATTVVHYLAGLYEQHAGFRLRHVFLGKNTVATQRAGDIGPATTVSYLFDHLGTLLLSLDDGARVVESQRYSPFGTALAPGGGDLDRYLGRARDPETGLLQFGPRLYAASIGRFLTPDWFVLENPGKAVRLPQGYNAYAYALNNPLVFKDPSGLWFGIDDLIVLGVGFVVGFVGGLIYGLANGQGWGSFLTALETGLTTAAGAWLGYLIAGPLGAVMGGFNGFVSGIHGIYDWTSASGWFAFLSDSTWNLLGTSMGNILHVINLFYSDANYREDLSRRQNRHVYEGGFHWPGKDEFAFTQGNVISNAGQGGKGINLAFIKEHEELHIWQQRFFGPIWYATYIVWGVGGFIVASVYWLFNQDKDWGTLVETAAYYDNPFEYWSYKNNNNWPPAGTDPDLRW